MSTAAQWAIWILVFATRAAVSGDADLAGAPPPPPAGTLVDGRGMPLEDARFIDLARGADFILLGESHPSRCDHQVQARLVELLAAAGVDPAIGMEMIAVDQREVLAQFNQGRLRAAELEQALRWSETWGFPFALYAPILAEAERSGLPLVALNAPRTLVHEAARHRWTAADVNPHELLPTEVVPPPEQERAFLVEQFQAHRAFGGGGPSGASPADEQDALERFLYAQAVWDTKMAQEAAGARAALGRPVIIIAGAGHVAHGWGIGSRLTRYSPRARTLSLVPWRGEDGPDPGAADLFFFCPVP